MPVAKKTAKKGRTWSHSLDVIGLRFRFTKSGRETLARMVEKKGSIPGMRLVREPDNQYDENAIMVMLPERILNGAQLGYLGRETAAVLAPRLDSGSVELVNLRLEGMSAKDEYNSGEMVARFRDMPRPAKKRGTKPKKK